MTLLLDTNALLWAVREPERLSAAAVDAIHTAAAVVSLASYWEIAIKQAIGKLDVDGPRLADWAEQQGIGLLAIKADHVWRTRDLPPLHRDPFDRLLVAQALCEGLTVVTSDALMARYGVPIVPA